MGRLVKRFGSVIPGEVLDARVHARAILRSAEEQAASLISQARAEADAVREQARRGGDTAGRAEAEIAFTELLVAARADAERVRAAAVPEARMLAARMAEKIIGRMVRVDPAMMADIAAGALAAARARSGMVSLRAHPDDLAALEAARPALVARLGAAVELRLIPDAAVERAGCIVETAAGRLDARLTTQLAALQRAVYGGQHDDDSGSDRDRDGGKRAGRE